MDTTELTKFLHQLSVNNDKEWFDLHRNIYDALRKEFVLFVTDIIILLTQKDNGLGTQNPKEAIFRINRDVRFSKDKTPYRTKFRAAFAPGGRRTSQPMYYFHLDEEGVLLLGAGLYDAKPEDLDKIRHAFIKKYEKLDKILQDKELKNNFSELSGDKLKNAPRGFAADHPAIELLKLKSFFLRHEIKIDEVEGNLAEYIVKKFSILQPFMVFMREAIY